MILMVGVIKDKSIDNEAQEKVLSFFGVHMREAPKDVQPQKRIAGP